MNAMLSVQGLTKHYPGFSLTDISFSIMPGRVMGLIGKNGAGKTTTLKAMLNMVRPDGGRIEMLGCAFAANEQEIKRSIGVVLGGIDFYKHKRISAIAAVTKRFYADWDERAFQTYLRAFELEPQKKATELSSGMRVKFMIALALSHGAKLLILDEPTSGLDPVSRDDLLRLFRSLVKNGDRSILFSTHITSDLERCADDITYIKAGQVLASADKAAFIKSFRHLWQAGETGELSLEEIMLRCERGKDYAELDL